MTPVQATAYVNISLDSFQSTAGGQLTGEIYYHTTGPVQGGPILSPGFAHCVDRSTTIIVPGNYYAEASPVAAPPAAYPVSPDGGLADQYICFQQEWSS